MQLKLQEEGEKVAKVIAEDIISETIPNVKREFQGSNK